MLIDGHLTYMYSLAAVTTLAIWPGHVLHLHIVQVSNRLCFPNELQQSKTWMHICWKTHRLIDELGWTESYTHNTHECMDQYYWTDVWTILDGCMDDWV